MGLFWGYASALSALPAELYPHVTEPLDFQRVRGFSIVIVELLFGVAHRMLCAPNLTMRYPQFRM